MVSSTMMRACLVLVVLVSRNFALPVVKQAPAAARQDPSGAILARQDEAHPKKKPRFRHALHNSTKGKAKKVMEDAEIFVGRSKGTKEPSPAAHVNSTDRLSDAAPDNEVAKVINLAKNEAKAASNSTRKKKIMHQLYASPAEDMKPMIKVFKQMIVKLEKLNEHDGDENRMAFCDQASKDLASCKVPFLDHESITYKEHSSSECLGVRGSMDTEMISDAAEECQTVCNDLGPECAGFMHMTSGLDAGKCLFQKVGITGIKTSKKSTCFEKEDSRDSLVKKYIALNLWVLKRASSEIDWICQAGFRSAREENRAEAFREIVQAYEDGARCQPGDIPCRGGHLLGEKPNCKCIAQDDYDCSAPPVVQHVQTICKGGNTKKSPKCSIQCAEGYTEVGSVNTFQCTQQGTHGNWSGDWIGTATCLPMNCGAPPEIYDATQNREKVTYPNSVDYTCNFGFTKDAKADGVATFSIKCTHTGKYEPVVSSEHVCKPVECGKAPLLANAAQPEGKYVFSDIVTYNCDEGTTLDATAAGIKSFEVSCEGTGLFSKGPECKPVVCGPAPVLSAASHDHGSTELVFKDEAKYKCIEGYTLPGKHDTGEVDGKATFTLRCEATGEFEPLSGVMPSCEPVTCGHPPAIMFGLLMDKEMIYQEEQAVTAKVGYSTSKKPHDGVSFLLQCSADGTFAGKQDFLPVECGAVPDVEHATPQSPPSVAKYTDEITYTCENGYSVDQTRDEASLSFVLTCESEGLFTEVPALGSCQDINDCLYHTCGPFGHCVDELLDYQCNCNPGYEMVLDEESGEKLCGNIDDCGPSQCGVGDCEDLKEDYKCHCPTGYEETQMPEEKTCTKVVCGTPPMVNNGATVLPQAAMSKASYQDTVAYMCNSGYATDPVDVTKKTFKVACQDDKSFTAPKDCKPVDCGAVPSVNHAKADKESAVFPLTVKYTCEEGYTTDGVGAGRTQFSIHCSADATYSATKICHRVMCGEPEEVANSARDGGIRKYKETVDYTCFSGYSLDGKADGDTTFSRECKVNGQFSSHPECQPIGCGVLSDKISVKHAQVLDDGAPTHYPNAVVVECEWGYTEDGTATGFTQFVVECQADGSFARHSECQPVSCGEAPDLSHATKSSGKITFETVATYTCEEGYTVGGQHDGGSTFEIQCQQSGQFSIPATDLQCQNVNDCLNHTCGAHGTCVDEVAGYTCKCDSGFSMKEISGEKICGNIDDCGGHTCGQGNCVDLVSDYQCDCPTGYYQDLVVQDLLEEKTCVPLVCALAAPPLAHGSLQLRSSIKMSDKEDELRVRTDGPVKYPEVLSYRCDPGYSTDGSMNVAKKTFLVTCQSSGALEDMSHCMKVNCGVPPAVNLATLESPSSFSVVQFGDSASYKCDTGHSTNGNHDGTTQWSIACQQNGLFEEPKVCQPVSCGTAPGESNAEPNVAGVVTYGMDLVYTCNTGFTLNAKPDGPKHYRRTCQASDGRFSEVDSELSIVLLTDNSQRKREVRHKLKLPQPRGLPSTTTTTTTAYSGCHPIHVVVKTPKVQNANWNWGWIQPVANCNATVNAFEGWWFFTQMNETHSIMKWDPEFEPDFLSEEDIEGNPVFGSGVGFSCCPGYSLDGSPGGPTDFETVVDDHGHLSLAVPAACVPITYMVHGRVTNARTLTPISGVNVKSGEVEATTGALGFYTLELQPGEHDFELSGAGLISSTNKIVVGMNNIEGGAADMRILPELQEDQWVAVLRWGEESKSDLDVVLTWGSTLINRGFRGASVNNVSGVLEAKTKNGTETAYFGGIGNCELDGFYCDVAYKVNAYAGDLESSKAVVTLYHGSEAKSKFDVADCAGAVADDSWWHVFTIDAKTNQLKWTCKDGPELISLHQSPNKMKVDYKSYKGPFPGRFFRHSRHPKKVQKGKRKNHAIRSMAPSPVERQVHAHVAHAPKSQKQHTVPKTVKPEQNASTFLQIKQTDLKF